MLLLFLLFLLDEGEISGISHFNYMNVVFFFNILKVVHKFVYFLVFSCGTVLE